MLCSRFDSDASIAVDAVVAAVIQFSQTRIHRVGDAYRIPSLTELDLLRRVRLPTFGCGCERECSVQTWRMKRVGSINHSSLLEFQHDALITLEFKQLELAGCAWKGVKMSRASLNLFGAGAAF